MITSRYLSAVLLLAWMASASALGDQPPTIIVLPGERAYPESVTSTSDGTVYIGSLGSGGIWRAGQGARHAQPWIKPGAQGSHSVFGVLADERSGTLWACSNDLTARGIQVGPVTAEAPGSALVGFDLKSGRDKVRVAVPGEKALCNDLAIGGDGAAYVTNMLAGQILRLRAGAQAFEVWSADPQFLSNGTGSLDGIAFAGDGNLFVNSYTTGKLFRVAVRHGVAGKVTELQTSRPLVHPDGMRHIAGNSLLLVEGDGRLDRVMITGDHAAIDTIRDGFEAPTGVTLTNGTAWVSEGQLAYLFDPDKRGHSPHLPFKVYSVAVVQ